MKPKNLYDGVFYFTGALFAVLTGAQALLATHLAATDPADLASDLGSSALWDLSWTGQLFQSLMEQLSGEGISAGSLIWNGIGIWQWGYLLALCALLGLCVYLDIPKPGQAMGALTAAWAGFCMVLFALTVRAVYQYELTERLHALAFADMAASAALLIADIWVIARFPQFCENEKNVRTG